jgi:predicted HAD superfamily hydrolase
MPECQARSAEPVTTPTSQSLEPRPPHGCGATAFADIENQATGLRRTDRRIIDPASSAPRYREDLFVIDKNFFSSLEDAMDASDLISFDVFDTLLRRPFLRPTHLFDCIAPHLGDGDFAYKRGLAEASARQKYKGAIDVTLDQIYEFLEHEPVQELECERRSLAPREEICALLRTAAAKGKKVIAISDMYWPRSTLAELLSGNGITVDDLIVSSTDGAAKFDGSAFRLAAMRHGVTFNRILHFGDNAEADFAVPSRLGMRAVLVGNWTPGGTACELTDALLARLAANGSHASSTIGAAIRDLRFQHGHQDFWRDLGRYHVGPLIYGFAHWLDEMVARKGIEHLIFVARDGWLPFKVFGALNQRCRSTYAYLSRAVLVQASLEKLPEVALRQLVSGVPAPVSDYIGRIGALRDALLPLALQAFGADAMIGKEADRRKLSALFQQHRDLLAEHGREALSALRDYLGELGAFGNPDRVAYVDIGWSGTGAALLTELFPEARRWQYLFWGTLEGFQAPSVNHSAQFFQFGEPWHHRALAFECIEVVEFFFTSAEQSAISLRRTPEGVRPVFSDDGEAWPERTAIANAIEAGVIECVEHLEAVRARYPALQVDRHTIFAILENILKTDSLTCVRQLGGIRHQLGLGESKAEVLLPDLSDRYWSTIFRWLRGRGMKVKHRRIYWPYQQERGFVASLTGVRGALARWAFQFKQRGAARRLSRRRRR